MAEPRPITGTMLRDLHLCERRAALDMHGDPSARDATSDFVRMLWAAGVAHEATILAGLGEGVADLRDADPRSRAPLTAAAMAKGARTVLGGEISNGDLLGRPDVLARDGDHWTAGDVKSGSPFDGDGARPKAEYAIQVGHYARILALNGDGTPGSAFVIGADGTRADYDLLAPRGRSGPPVAVMVEALTDKGRGIRDGSIATRPAAGATCGLCHWRTVRTAELERDDDPTLVAGIGRATRDGLAPAARTVAELAALDTGRFAAPGGRTTLRGIGGERLDRFRDRARLLLTPGAQPYARRPLGLARRDRELHLDLEADPQSGVVYLHGVLDVRDGAAPRDGRFVHFMADGPDGERRAFADAIEFLSADPEAPIYYYSAFEPVSYRALQRRHPDVCSEADVAALFAPGRGVDLLLGVVQPDTEWPTRNLSIKTLAKRLGFAWRHADASGAASIVWWHEWLRDRDPTVRQRIIDYNNDDVVASAVLLDGLIALEVRDPPPWPPAPAKAPVTA